MNEQVLSYFHYVAIFLTVVLIISLVINWMKKERIIGIFQIIMTVILSTIYLLLAFNYPVNPLLSLFAGACWMIFMFLFLLLHAGKK